MFKKIIQYGVLFSALCFFITITARAQEPIKLVGFGALPYTIVGEGKKLSGVAFDFVSGLLDAAKIPYEAEGLPIGRVLESLDHGNSVSVFTARNPSREDKYTWIAELVGEEGFVFVTRADHKPVASYEDAKGLKLIGAIQNGTPVSMLQAAGLTNVDPGASEEINAKKLIAGRIDAWYTAAGFARYVLKQEQIAGNAVIIGPRIVPAPFWIAGSKTLPKETVEKIRAVFADSKTNGKYAAFRAQID